MSRPPPEQMPGILEKIDDPWGISWRLANAIKRLSFQRTRKFLSAYMRGVEYKRPVFILGVPRSGTSLLFALLRESQELGALPGEGHDMWRTYHHPRWTGWVSDSVEHGAVGFGERRFVNAYLSAYMGTTRRFVEKTPENTLRIPYLLELFPDATFVVMKRNPGDVIHSLIQGWRHPAGRFRSYYVPQQLSIPDYPHHRRWCFALIQGWRDYVAAPIPDIAFAQWEQCTRALVAARSVIPRSRCLEVHFEHLLERPDEILAHICEGIAIQNTAALRKKLAELLREPVNALSAPGLHKWRRKNPAEIARLLPQMAALARDMGYQIDAASGDFEIRQALEPAALPVRLTLQGHPPTRREVE